MCVCGPVGLCFTMQQQPRTAPAIQTSSATRSRLLHDKVTSSRLRATSAVIHLCQKKTGIKKRDWGKIAIDREVWVEDKEDSGDN